MKKFERGWLDAAAYTLASLRRPPVASGRRVDHFAVQHRTARHDRRPQLPSPYSFSTGFERVAMVARSTCSMTIKPARSRRSVPTRFCDGPSDPGVRHDATLLLRRHHLRRLVHRAPTVQGLGLQQTQAESKHVQNLHLQVGTRSGILLTGVTPLRGQFHSWVSSQGLKPLLVAAGDR